MWSSSSVGTAVALYGIACGLVRLLEQPLFCTVLHGEETASDDDESVDGRREIKV